MLALPGCPRPLSAGMGRETQSLGRGLLRGRQVGPWLRLRSPSEASEVGGGGASRLMPALPCNSPLLSVGTCWLSRSHPRVGHPLRIMPSPPVGREEGGRTPNLTCGGSGILLSRAVDPCYLSESEPAWPHLGMFSGFGPGVIPLE